MNEQLLKLIIGIIWLWIFGAAVTCLMNAIKTNRPRLEKAEEEELEKIMPPKDDFSDKWLGWTERLISFASGWVGQYAFIVAWLTFKIAAKWENWKNITQFSKKDASIRVRRFLGGYVYTRFLIGTGLNILAGVVSYELAKTLAPEIANLINYPQLYWE